MADKVFKDSSQKAVVVEEQYLEKMKERKDITEEIQKALESTSTDTVVTTESLQKIQEILREIKASTEDIFADVDDTSDSLISLIRLLQDSLGGFGTKVTNTLRQTQASVEKIAALRASGELLSYKSFTSEKARVNLQHTRIDLLMKQCGLADQLADIQSRNKNNPEQEKQEIENLKERTRQHVDYYSKLVEEAKLREREIRRSGGLRSEKASDMVEAKKDTQRLTASLDTEKAKAQLLDLHGSNAVILQALFDEKQVSQETKKVTRQITRDLHTKKHGFGLGLDAKIKISSKLGLSDFSEYLSEIRTGTQEAVKSSYQTTLDKIVKDKNAEIDKRNKGKKKKEPKHFADDDDRKAAWEEGKKSGKEYYKKVSKGTGGIFESFKNLAGPVLLAAAIASIGKALLEVSKEAANVKQITGTWGIGVATANSKFATTQQTLKAVVELADAVKIDPTALFTPSELSKMAEAKNLLGLSASQASNLTVRTKLAGGSAEQYRQALANGISAGNGLNKTAIGLGTATREALETSDAIALSMGNNATKIGKAVVAAQSLGLSLKDVENISQQLINFESSIGAEMEAQLLTGMNLNLSKARELALNNDLEGVAREIGNQGINAAKWGSMNYIQQNRFAQAIGMSRDQMAKMLIQQELSNGLSSQAIANAMGLKAEQIEAMGIQDRWKTATEKLAEAFTPILEMLIPIVEWVSKIMSKVAWLIGTLTSFKTLGSDTPRRLDRIERKKKKLLSEKNEAIQAGETDKVAQLNEKIREQNDLLAQEGNISKANTASMASFGNESQGAFGKILKSIGSFLLISFSLGAVFPKLAGKIKDFSLHSISSLGNLVKGIAHPKKALKSLADSVSSAWKGGKEKIEDKVKGEVGSGAAEKATKAGEKAAKNKGDNLPDLGENLKDFFDNVGEIEWKSIALALAMVPTLTILSLAAIPIAALSGTGYISGGLGPLGKNIKKLFNGMQGARPGKAWGVIAALLGLTVLAVPIAALSAVGFISGGLVILGKSLRSLFNSLSSAAGAAGGFSAAMIAALPGIGIVAGMVAILTGAAIGIGFALKLMTPAIEALGNVLSKVFAGISTLVVAVAQALVTSFTGIAKAVKTLTLKDAGNLLAFGGSLVLFSGSALLALPGLALFALTALPIFRKLTKYGNGIGVTASNLKILAESIKNLSTTIKGLDVSKLQDALKIVSKASSSANTFKGFRLPKLLVSKIKAKFSPEEKQQSLENKLEKGRQEQLKTETSSLIPTNPFSTATKNIESLVAAVRHLGEQSSISSKAVVSKKPVELEVPVTIHPFVHKIEKAETREKQEEDQTRIKKPTLLTKEEQKKQQSVDLTKVEGLLKTIITKLAEGQNIYLDVDKVGHTLAWATTKL